jgi:hypothetical protein
MKGFASIVPPDADVSAVADAIVNVVDTPFGKRSFRVHIDPTEDGAEVVNMVSDRVRAELLRRIGLADLLAPAVSQFDAQHCRFSRLIRLYPSGQALAVSANRGVTHQLQISAQLGIAEAICNSALTMQIRWPAKTNSLAHSSQN